MDEKSLEYFMEEIKEIKHDVKTLLAWKNELAGKISAIVFILSTFFTGVGLLISVFIK